MTSHPHLDIRLRILFEPGGPPLGPGKIDLLEQIAAGGSLAHAAAELGMSYRRAWALLQELAEMFGRPAAVTTVGGPAGGGAKLTPFAYRLIESYRAVERLTLAAAAEQFAFAARSRTRRRGGAAHPRAHRTARRKQGRARSRRGSRSR